MKETLWWDPFPRRNIVIFFSLFLFFSALFLGVFFAISYDSDHASLLLEAKDILDGNIFLKGWDLSTVTFMTTEIPIAIAGILIFGYSENVIYFVSAVTYAIMTVLLVYFCSVTRFGKVRFDRAVISGSLSILIMSLASVWGLLAPVHIVGFIYCLILLLILRHIEDRFQLGHAIIFGLLSLLLYFGDTFFIYNFALPLVVVAVFNLFFGREIRKNLILIGETSFSILLAYLFINLIEYLGGFHLPGIDASFIPITDLSKKFNLLIVGLLDTFSINFFGKPLISFASLQGLTHLAILILFIFVLIFNLRKLSQIKFTNKIMIVGILVNLSAYFLSTAAFRRTIIHYLLPSLIYGIILMTEFVSEHRTFQYRKTAILVVSVIVGLLTLPKMSLIKTAPEFTGFGGVLIEKGLKNGYAAFFSASVNTVHYDSRVTVRPIHSTTVYTVQRFPWLSKDSWYEEPAHFVVIQNPPDFGVTEEAVINTFGEPDRVIAEGNYSILVWEKDIAPLLPDQ